MAELIVAEGFKTGGIKSKMNPAGYAWHQLSKLEKGEPVEREAAPAEGGRETVTVVPVKLVGYAEKVRPDGLWCLHADNFGKHLWSYTSAEGQVFEEELDTTAWNNPYKKAQEDGYKSAFANKRDKNKAPPYRGICLHSTESGQLGPSLALLVGVGRKVSVPYLIDRDGTIYELYDPEEYWSGHVPHNPETTIGVALVNRCAIPDAEAEALKPADVFTSAEPFREATKFQNYTAEQNLAVVKLLRYLCARFGIGKKFPSDDPARMNDYLESKTQRDTLIGIYTLSNLVNGRPLGVGPAFPWKYVQEELLKPGEITLITPPGPTATQNPTGTGKFFYPVDAAKYLEAATDKSGLTQRKIEGDDAYANLMRISRRVGLDTSEWKPLEEGRKPPYGPFPMFVDGAFNDGVKIGMPREWGEIAGKLEVRAVADGEVVARGGELESEPGKHELGFVIVKHQTPRKQDFWVLYAGLWGMDSTEGDVVAAGDYLGVVGHHPEFPHVHISLVTKERLPPESQPEERQWFGPEMTLEQVMALGSAQREAAWNVARITLDEPPLMFKLAGLEGKVYLYNPIHFIRWMRGEEVNLAIANPPVEAEIEEKKQGGVGGTGHTPVAMLQCAPFKAEPAIQRFFARTVVKPLDKIDPETDVLKIGSESKGGESAACVVALQKALIALGYLQPIPEEKLGTYDEKTSCAVRAFETANKEAMKYSDGTQLVPNGECDWVTLKAIDSALLAIEQRPRDVVGTRTVVPRTRPTAAPAASPPILLEGGAVKLPERWVYMAGGREFVFPDMPSFAALRSLKPRTTLFCYIDGGKHEFGRVLFEDERRTHWGPAKVGNLDPFDYLAANREKLKLPEGVAAVLMSTAANNANLDAVNMWTRSFVSFGMLQWPMHNGSLVRFLFALKKKDAGTFDTYFKKNGLDIEEKDGVLFLKLDDKAVYNTKDLVRSRDHTLVHILRLKWAFLFYAAGRDPKVQEFQVAQAREQIQQLFETLIVAEDKPLKEFVDSQLGMALVFDQFQSVPGRVKESLAAALADTRAKYGGAYDKNDPAQQETFLWNYVAARCQSRMFDPWNRAARLWGMSAALTPPLDKEQVPKPGTIDNWEKLWKPLWEPGPPVEGEEAFTGVPLDLAPGSFKLD